jgi:hypothetical protein
LVRIQSEIGDGSPDVHKEFQNRLVELRLTQAYIHLLLVPVDDHGVRTIPFARFGNYEVRLSEFMRDHPGTDDKPMWLELYARDSRSGIDSCACHDLEEALVAANLLVSHAKELNERYSRAKSAVNDNADAAVRIAGLSTSTIRAKCRRRQHP